MYLNLLGVLQSERMTSYFFNEDLSQFDDEQIGTAVRGRCMKIVKKTIGKFLLLKPFIDKEESEDIIIEENFDTSTIKLTGKVMSTPRFERIAIGDHLILGGGDNVDFGIAKYVQKGLKKLQRNLSKDKWKALFHQSRQVKENILNNCSNSEVLTIMGSEVSMIARTISGKISREELEKKSLIFLLQLLIQNLKNLNILMKPIILNLIFVMKKILLFTDILGILYINIKIILKKN